MITFKQFLAEDPLFDLSLEMAIRKELGVDHALAAATLNWLRDGTTSTTSINDDDEEVDIFNALSSRFNDRMEKEQTPHHDIDEMLQLWMTKLLKTKYKLNLTEAKEDFSLISGLLSNLLRKGELVKAYAEVWNSDPKKMKPELYTIRKVKDARVYLQVGQNVQTWFELNPDGDVHDDMYLQKEGDFWVLAEPKRKFIRT